MLSYRERYVFFDPNSTYQTVYSNRYFCQKKNKSVQQRLCVE